MATRAQKKFRKDMKKLQKQVRKQKANQKQSVQYMYGSNGFTKPSVMQKIKEMLGKWTDYIPRLLLIIALLYITGMGRELSRIIQEFIPNSALNQQKLVVAYMEDYNQLIKTTNEITERYNTQMLEQGEVYMLYSVVEDLFDFLDIQTDKIFTSFNDVLNLYEVAYLQTLTLLFPISINEQNELLKQLVEVETIRYQVRSEALSLLQSTGFTYELLEDDTIKYTSSYPLLGLGRQRK